MVGTYHPDKTQTTLKHTHKKTHPNAPQLYNNRATAQSKLRRHQEAVDDCGRAIALDKDYLKAFRRRAESLYALGGQENLEQVGGLRVGRACGRI